MQWVDIAIIGIIIISMITGCIRGFVKEIIALGIWILGFYLAYKYSGDIANQYKHYIADDTFRAAVVFGGILVGTVIIGAFFNMALHYILRHGGLSGTDKLLGAVFGFIRAIFIVTFIMVVAKNISIAEKYTKQCELCKGFEPLINWFSPYMHKIISKVDIATRDHTEWLPETHLDVETA